MNLRHSTLLATAIAALISGSAGRALAAEVSGRVTDAVYRPAAARGHRPAPGLLHDAATAPASTASRTCPPARTRSRSTTSASRAPLEVVTVTDGGREPSRPANSDLEVITVSGTRLAQATALQDKKSSKVIKESVTANDAGKLPDQNAAETLVRVSGVSVTTDQGEGRYVTIRGIDAALNNVTIDSQIIGSPEGDTRRVALDTVPANLLSKLEVIKSVTPDLDGNAIGGTINLVTPSAFDDPDGDFLSATVDFGYYDLGGQNPWGRAPRGGRVFGDDRWGVVLSASYSDREFTTHNLQGGDPWVEEGDYLVPDEMGCVTT